MSMNESIKQVLDFAVNVDFVKEVFAIVEKEQPDILKRAMKIIQSRYPDYMEGLYLDVERKRTIREAIEKVLIENASVQKESINSN